MSTNIKDMRARSDWASAKLILETRGITAPQLRRYAADGLIRTSNILRPGQSRGKRLYNVGDVDRLIEVSIETHGNAVDVAAETPEANEA